MKIIRTDSSHADFQSLVALLDQDLRLRDGDEHAYYAQFNKIDHLQNVVVAYVENNAVGCGAFKNYSEQIVEIKRMYVRPEYRGQRIAQHILSDLENWAGELGSVGCVLETGLRQPEAIRLYQRCGYERIPNYGQYIGIANSVCMQKKLPEPL